MLLQILKSEPAYSYTMVTNMWRCLFFTQNRQEKNNADMSLLERRQEKHIVGWSLKEREKIYIS
jgi:hypothetical protein